VFPVVGLAAGATGVSAGVSTGAGSGSTISAGSSTGAGAGSTDSVGSSVTAAGSSFRVPSSDSVPAAKEVTERESAATEATIAAKILLVFIFLSSESLKIRIKRISQLLY
jgi:hypothetical protein